MNSKLLIAGFAVGVAIAVGALGWFRSHWPQRAATYEQTCLMCGATFTVTPTTRGVKPRPTTEWCIYDEKPCQDGLHLVLVLEAMPKDPRLIEHCRKCLGCRCTFYSPEEWKNSMDNERTFRLDLDRVVALAGSLATVAVTALVTRCIERTNPKKGIGQMNEKQMKTWAVVIVLMTALICGTVIQVNRQLTNAAGCGCDLPCKCETQK